MSSQNVYVLPIKYIVMNDNEVYIDFLAPLNKKEVSKTAKVLLSILVLSVIIAYIYMYIQAKMHPFFIVFWSLYGVLGLYQVYTGKRIINLFGKSFIKINQEKIIYKPNIFKKEIVYPWQDINAVISKPGYLLFENKNTLHFKLPYNNMEYLKVQEVKSKIEKIVKEKAIEYK